MTLPAQIGKYRIEGLLGQGAMGAVYLGEDPLLGRKVAVKVMSGTADAEGHERFLQEARVVARLSHPGIVVLLEFGFHDSQPYLVMEHLPGRSLEEWLRAPHGLSERLGIVADLSAALAYAHAQDVLHRDVKPSNVQVMADGKAKLMDFGIARAAGTRLTATGTVMGTPNYMAPELLSGGDYSPRSDLYSACVVFYEMFGGGNPFDAPTVAQCFHNVLTVAPPHLTTKDPHVPRALADVVMAGLSKDPAARPEGLDAILRAVSAPVAAEARGTQTVSVERVAAQAPTAVPPGAPAAGPPVASRTPGRARAVGGVLVAVALAGAWWASTRLAPRTSATPGTTTAMGSPGVAPTIPAPAVSTTGPAPPGESVASDAPGATSVPPPVRHEAVAGTTAPPARARAAPQPTAAPASAPPPAAVLPPTTSGPAPAVRDDASRAVATAPPTTATTPRSEPPPTTPVAEPSPPAAPGPGLTGIEPSVARRGASVVVELRGTGLTDDLNPVILRGRRPASGLHVVRHSSVGPDRWRLTILVDEDVALGRYLLVLRRADGTTTNAVILEVTL